MQPIDYMRSGALVLAFAVTAFQDVKTWLLTDFIATAVFGIGFYLMPDGLLGYMTEGPLDVVHQYYMQIFGLLLLGLAMVWYECRRSPDANVITTLLLSKVVGLSALVIAQIYAQLHYRKEKNNWNEQHLYFGILGNSLWLLGNVYHLVRSRSFGTYSTAPNQLLNQLLYLLGFFGILQFCLLFSYPDYGFRLVALKDFKPDGIHLHLARSCGCLILTFAVFALRAVHFRDILDKRQIFLTGLVGLVLSLITMGLHQQHSGIFHQQGAPWMISIGGLVSLGINSVGFYKSRT